MDATTATIDQVGRLIGRLGEVDEVPLFVFDAGYDGVGIRAGLSNTRVEVLVRIGANRVFHPDPAPRKDGTIGRPRRHGMRFALSETGTWTAPDAEATAHDPRYGTVSVTAWHGLHPKLQAEGAGRLQTPRLSSAAASSVSRSGTFRSRPPGRGRPSGCGGPAGACPISTAAGAPTCGASTSSTMFRFAKGTLGWTTPAVRTPEQADRWTLLVVVGYTQLRLARGLLDDLRLPWERPQDPALLTPARVRRGFGDFVRSSARRRVHRNPRKQGPGDRKGSEDLENPLSGSQKGSLSRCRRFTRKLRPAAPDLTVMHRSVTTLEPAPVLPVKRPLSGLHEDPARSCSSHSCRTARHWRQTRSRSNSRPPRPVAG